MAKKLLLSAGVVTLAFIVSFSGVRAQVLHAGSRVLPIQPIAQQTPEWCWLASAEMIFRYYRIPPANGISYQCGIMGAVTGPRSICFTNCAACQFGSGSDANSALVLQQYPQILQAYFFRSIRVPQLAVQLAGRPLFPAEVEQQIDTGHPVELGVTVGGPFQGQAGHDVVLVGYAAYPTGVFAVVIDDPYPYDSDPNVGPQRNPYRLIGATPGAFVGQYYVEYNTAIRGLQWSDSIVITPH
jgi:hypothetical protein